MINKNDEYIVEITGYTTEGQGVARVNDFVVFVPFSIIGEKVKVHIIKTYKTYVVGKIVEIIVASKERVEPKCSVFKKCGGCALQHINYPHTLEMKRGFVRDSFVKFAGLKEIDVKKTIASNNIYCYRNKSAFPIIIGENGDIELCMFRELSHNPIVLDDCPITMDSINEIATIVKNTLNKVLNLEQKQLLRYLVVRIVEKSAIVTIVSLKKTENLEIVYDELIENFKNLTISVWSCVKSKDNNVILEGALKLIKGAGDISCNVMGVNVEVSPFSFFQVNRFIMEQIYQTVISNIEDDKVVIDAYSGAGLMSALLCKKSKHVYAIEIIKEATLNAERLKEKNKITNLTNINGDAKIEVPKIIEKLGRDLIVVLDPPRKGADSKVLESILKCAPQKIIYVSCNPATLARDVKYFINDYSITLCQPFDMFPQTAHVETVVVLEKIQEFEK